MELDIYRFRVKVFMKEPLKQTTELASAHRDFRIQISIRVSIKWESFMEKVFTYGLLEPVFRGILFRDSSTAKANGNQDQVTFTLVHFIKTKNMVLADLFGKTAAYMKDNFYRTKSS